MKYRKKPITIEAVQWEGDFIVNGKNIAPDWINEALGNGTMYFRETGDSPSELFIATLEGEHHVSFLDYIIQGVQGKLYPCKPDIFEVTYERVDEE